MRKNVLFCRNFIHLDGVMTHVILVRTQLHIFNASGRSHSAIDEVLEPDVRLFQKVAGVKLIFYRR